LDFLAFLRGLRCHRLWTSSSNDNGRRSRDDAGLSAPLPWQLSLIPIFTPLIIQAVKMFVPKIPTLWLPVMAPFLGALLDVISHYSTGSNISIGTAAALGLAGVGVREVVDQIQKVSPAGPSVPTVATVPFRHPRRPRLSKSSLSPRSLKRLPLQPLAQR